MANWWESAPVADTFDVALAAEKADPAIAAIARSIYQQETSSGKNVKTSNAGAVGHMQLITPTFKSVAEKDWDIDNPVHNIRAGIRYLTKLNKMAGGDPELTAVGYYGGPGAIQKARKGQAVSDPRNPNAPDTLQYARQVVSRIGNAIVPSAQAAQTPWWESAPVVDAPAQASAPKAAVAPSTAPVEAPAEEGSAVGNFVRGIGQGIAVDVLGGPAQAMAHGVAALAEKVAPNSNYAKNVRRKATEFDQKMQAFEKEYQASTPGSVAAGAGRVIGNLPALALPVAGAGAATGLGRVAAGVGAGALGGAAAPVLEGDYAEQKAGQIGTGALIGGALGGAGALAGKAVDAFSGTSDEVAALAQRAKTLGIDVRPDQLTNSKPVAAVSSALDWMPLTGKGKSLEVQQKQFNTALSRTIGENTDNVAQAINKAENRLGGIFDKTLKNATVKLDDQFSQEIQAMAKQASDELVDNQAKMVSRALGNLANKVDANGNINGEAAYNIKKMLDRMSKSQDSSVAHYGRELRNSLMGALNRSLPDDGAEFAKVRRQWANLMELRKIVPAGAEGDISAARLANARGINTPDLSELRDIAAQFLKGKVGDSGTAQRSMAMGALGGAAVVEPSLAIGALTGNVANRVLGSQALTNRMINGGGMGNPVLTNQLINAGAYGAGMSQ